LSGRTLEEQAELSTDDLARVQSIVTFLCTCEVSVFPLQVRWEIRRDVDGAILAWSHALKVWHLALTSFIRGLTWTTDNPVRRTMIGEVIGPDRMSAAMSIDVGASRMLGPTVGGILLATLGIGGAFTVSVTGYLSRRLSRCGCAIATRRRSPRLQACSNG
jgi:MFS family permease